MRRIITIAVSLLVTYALGAHESGKSIYQRTGPRIYLGFIFHH